MLAKDTISIEMAALLVLFSIGKAAISIEIRSRGKSLTLPSPCLKLLFMIKSSFFKAKHRDFQCKIIVLNLKKCTSRMARRYRCFILCRNHIGSYRNHHFIIILCRNHHFSTTKRRLSTEKHHSSDYCHTTSCRQGRRIVPCQAQQPHAGS